MGLWDKIKDYDQDEKKESGGLWDKVNQYQNTGNTGSANTSTSSGIVQPLYDDRRYTEAETQQPAQKYPLLDSFNQLGNNQQFLPRQGWQRDNNVQNTLLQKAAADMLGAGNATDLKRAYSLYNQAYENLRRNREAETGYRSRGELEQGLAEARARAEESRRMLEEARASAAMGGSNEFGTYVTGGGVYDPLMDSGELFREGTGSNQVMEAKAAYSKALREAEMYERWIKNLNAREESERTADALKNASRSELERTAAGRRYLERQALGKLTEASDTYSEAFLHNGDESSLPELQEKERQAGEEYAAAIKGTEEANRLLRAYNENSDTMRALDLAEQAESDPNFREKVQTGKTRWQQEQSAAKADEAERNRQTTMANDLNDPELQSYLEENRKAAGVNTDLETKFAPENLNRAGKDVYEALHGFRPETLSQDQRDIYYALYADDPKLAAQWAKIVTGQVDQAYLQKVADWAGKNPKTRVAALLAGSNMTLASGLDPFGERGQWLNEYGQTLLSGGGQGLQEKGLFNTGALAGEIKEDTPVVGWMLKGKSLNDLYQLTGSMIQSGETALLGSLTGPLGAAAGTMLMGSSAAASDYREQLDRGVDEKTAKGHAIAAGIAEALFEYVSIDKLLNQDITKTFLRNFLEQAGVEASEEITTSIANRLSDGLILHANGYDSDLDRRRRELMAQGLSYQDADARAEWDWVVDVLNDGLGGFLSGGMMTVGNYAGSYAAGKIGAGIDSVKFQNQRNEAYGQLAQSAEAKAALQQYAADNNIKVKFAAEPSQGLNYNQNAQDEGGQIARATENGTENKSAAASKATTRSDGKSVQKVIDSMAQQMQGQSLEQMQQTFDGLVEKYGDGIRQAAQDAVTQAAAQRFSDASNVAELEKLHGEEVKAAQGDLQQSVRTAYDMKAMELIAKEYKETGTVDRSRENAYRGRAGETVDVRASYANESGQTATAELSRINDDGTVTLTDGHTAKISDLQMDADTKSLLQDITRVVQGEEANALFSLYKTAVQEGGVTDGYTNLAAALTVYESAARGVSKSVALSQAKGLSRNYSEFAGRVWELGNEAHKQAVAAGQAKVDNGEVSKGKFKVSFDGVDYAKLNKAQRNMVNLATVIANATGIEIEFFQSKVENGKFVGEQGSYSNGKIRLDINAGKNYVGDVTNGMMKAMSHELTHFIEQFSPKLYAELKSAIMDVLTEKYSSEGVNRLIQEKIDRSKDGLSRTEAEAEVIADGCELLLRDSQAVQELMAEHRTLGEKILDWIEGFLKRLRDAFGDTDRAEAKAVMENLEKVQKLWDNALKDAVKAHNKVGNKNTASEGGEQFSFRNTTSGMANDSLLQYDAELRSLIESRGDVIVDNYNKLVDVVDMAFDQTTEKHTAYFGILDTALLDAITAETKNIPAALNGQLFKKGRQYSVAATLDDIRHLRDEKGLSREDVLDYLDRLADTIVDRDSVSFSYYTDSRQNKIPGLLFKKKFTDGTFMSFDLISNGKKSLTMQTLYMEKGDYKKRKSAKAPPLANPAAPTPKARAGQTSNNIILQQEAKSNTPSEQNSDRDYMAAVDRGDMETAQKMVDEAAKAAGYTIKAYHGTPNRFNVFQKYRIGSTTDYGWLGRGFYFTTKKDVADVYAGYLNDSNVIEAYLQVKNPFLFSEYPGAEDMSPGEIMQEVLGKKYGSRGELTEDDKAQRSEDFTEWLEENGYDGAELWSQIMILDSEQAKRSDPVTYDDQGNVIPLSERFNPKNEDIRYSDREYNHTVLLTEKTVDKYLADYASKSSPNYAQAYIVRMSPDDFLKLTTSKRGRDMIWKQTGKLDVDQLKDSTVQQPFQLRIDTETGEISGHEGRHRAQALDNESVTSIPVLLFDSGNKYSKTALESLTLHGQDFGNSRSDATVTVTDVQPLSYANRDNVIAKFTTQPSIERMGEKYGWKDTIRYSERDYDRPSDVDLLLQATETTNPEQKKLLQEFKAKQKEVDKLTKEQQKLKDQVADLQAQMKTTDRALNTKGISGVVRSIMTELGIGDAKQKGLAAKAASMLTDTYTEALAKIDANDPDGAWKVLSDGAQEIAEYLIDNGTYSEKFGYQWETTAWSKRFAENRSQAVRDIMGDIISDFSRNRYRNAIQPTKADRLVEKTAKGYEQKLSAQSEQLSAKTEENTRLQEENERLRRRLGFSESNEDSFREQLKRKERQLAEAQAEAKKSGKASTQLQSRIEALENRVQELRKERDSLKGKVERREGQIQRERKSASHDLLMSQINTRVSQFQTRLAEGKAARTEAGLRGQIAELEARISDYDKLIAKQQKIMEGKMLTKELQALLKKEREHAIAYTKQQKDQAFQNYKERKTETALRNRIRNQADEIKRTLLRPTDGRYVPAALFESMAKLTDVLAVEPKEGTKAAERYQQVQENIHKMADAYAELKNADDWAYSSEFEQEILDSIRELERIFDKGQSMIGDRATVRDLNAEELQKVYDLTRYVYQTMRDATKLMSNERYRNVYQAARAVAEQQMGMESFNKSKPSEQRKRMRQLKDLSVMRAVEMMSGWDRDAALYTLMHSIEQGTVDANSWIMNYNKSLQDLKTGKNELSYREALTKQLDYGVKDSEGLDVKMTKLQALQLLMTAEREAHNDKLVHLQKGGAVIRDAIAMQEGKKNAKSQTIQITPELLQKIQESLTDWDKAYMKAIRDYFAKESKEASRITYQLKHRALETEKFYVPYTVDKNYLDTKLDEAGGMTNIWVKAPGSTNQLQQNASQPVIIDGMDTVMKRHVQEMGNYIGLSMPVRDFAKVYNARLSQGDGSIALPVKQTIFNNYGGEGQHLLTQAIMDVQGATGNGNSWVSGMEEYMNRLYSAFVKSALLINPSVTIKQAASYLAAGSVLSRAALELGNRPVFSQSDGGHSVSLIAQLFASPEGKTAQRLYDEIDKYTSMHYDRRQGMSMAELANQAQRASALQRKAGEIGAKLEQTEAGHKLRKAGEMLDPTTWIQRMDVATTAALWVAAKEQARMDLKRTGNPSATDTEYWQHVTELYEQTLRETQPMYDGLHRTAAQKGQQGSVMQYLFPFRTVPTQNHGQIASAYEAMKAAKNKDAATQKEAVRHFKKTVWANTESAVIFSLMTFLAAGMKRKTKKYRDDDDEFTLGSIAKGIGLDVLNVWASNLFPLYGSELYDYIDRSVDALLGKKGFSFDTFSVGAVDLLNNLVQGSDKLLTEAGKLMRGESENGKALGQAALNLLLQGGKLAGIPADTIKTYFEGTKDNILDLMAGRIPAFNNESVERTAAVNAGRYLKAWQSGDSEKMDKVYQEMVQNFKDAGKSEKEAKEAARSAISDVAKEQRESGAWDIDQTIDFLNQTGLYKDDALTNKATGYIREDYSDGKLTKEQATEKLLQYHDDWDENDVYWKLQEWDANKEHEEDEDYKYSEYNDLRDAINAGKDISAAVEELTAHGKDFQSVNNSVKETIHKRYTRGEISEDEAMDELMKYWQVKGTKEYGAATEDDAWFAVQEWIGKYEHRDDKDYDWNKYEKVYSAIDANKDVTSAYNELVNHGIKKSSLKDAMKSYIVRQFEDGAYNEEKLKNYLARYCKITKKETVDDILTSAKCYKATGYRLNSIGTTYKDGEASKEMAKKILKTYGGLTDEEANHKIAAWDFQNKYPELEWDADRAENYLYKVGENQKKLGFTKSAKDMGIPVSVYDQFISQYNDIKGEDRNGDGKTDTNSLKKNRWKFIKSLNCTPEQQEWFFGWSYSDKKGRG